MSDQAMNLDKKSKNKVMTWCVEKDEQLKLLMLKRHFDPEQHKIDELGMKKVLGVPANYHYTPLLKQTFLKVIDQQLQEFKEKEKSYKFLQNMEFDFDDEHLNEQMGDVEQQLLSGEIIPLVKEPPLSINDDRPDYEPPLE